MPSFEPRYNVAPTQDVPLVLEEDQGVRKAVFARWGLVPFWAKDASIGNRLLNARGDTIRAKPAFRAAFRKRRGLMPADLFYEWQALPGSKLKQPWCIRMPGDAPFAFGAVWEQWLDRTAEDSKLLTSCAIVTTEPNAVMTPIHDRMPLIIEANDYDNWLDPAANESEAFELIRPYPGEMRAYRVSTWVNSPARTDSRCIEGITAD